MSRIVFIPMRLGQVLEKEVLQGLIINNCAAAPMVSFTDRHGRVDRENMAKNINAGFSFAEEYYLHMDSDVVLTPGIINTLITEARNFDLVIYRTGTNGQRHGLWMVKKKIVDTIPLTFESQAVCPVCTWHRKIKNKKSYTGYALKECPRRQLTRTSSKD